MATENALWFLWLLIFYKHIYTKQCWEGKMNYLLHGPTEKARSHKFSICIYYTGRHKRDSYSSRNWLTDWLLPKVVKCSNGGGNKSTKPGLHAEKRALPGTGCCPTSFSAMLWQWGGQKMLEILIEIDNKGWHKLCKLVFKFNGKLIVIPRNFVWVLLFSCNVCYLSFLSKELF